MKHRIIGHWKCANCLTVFTDLFELSDHLDLKACRYVRAGHREPELSDDELVAVRKMLAKQPRQ